MRSKDASHRRSPLWTCTSSLLLTLLTVMLLGALAAPADAAPRRGTCDVVRHVSPGALKQLQRKHGTLRRLGSFREVRRVRVKVKRQGKKARWVVRRSSRSVCVRPKAAAKAAASLQRTLGPPASGANVGPVDFPANLQGRVTIQMAPQLGTAGWQLLDMPAAPRRTFAAGTLYSTADADVFTKVDVGALKESIVVYRRQGVRTWRWRLHHDGGPGPRLMPDGSVRLGHQVRIRPPELQTPRGKVLRTGAWNVRGNVLELRVDDRSLPVPYVVDPSADYPQRLQLRSGASTTLTAPAGAGRLLPAVGVPGGGSDFTRSAVDGVGHTRLRPNRTNSAAPGAPPSNAAGPASAGSDGWLVDAQGGMTLPAGTYQVGAFLYRSGGPINAQVAIKARLWRVTTSAGSMTANVPITDWSASGPSATLNAAGFAFTTSPVAASATVLRPNDHVYVEIVVQVISPGAGPPTTYAVLKSENAASYVDFASAPYDQLPVPSGLQVRAATPIGATGWSTSRYPVFGADLVDPEWYHHNLFEFCSVATASAAATCSGTLTGTASSPTGQLLGGASNAIDASTWSPAAGLPDGTHYVRVRSVEDSGMSGQSDFSANSATSCLIVPSSCDVIRVDATVPAVTVTQPVTVNVANVPVSFAVSDATSGLSTFKVQRRSAALSGGACGVFGVTWDDVVTDPVSPYGDSTVADGNCYEYRIVAIDVAGNEVTVATGTPTMVDATAPTVTGVTLAELTGAAWTHPSAATMWYNPAQSGSFRVEVAVTDDGSAPASVTFPALGSGWTPAGSTTDSAGGSPYTTTYAFTSPPAPANPGAVSATARDVATNATAAPFSVRADGAPPSGGWLNHTNGIIGVSTLAVSYAMPADPDSGVGTWQLQRSDTTANAGVCDTTAWSAYGDVGAADEPTPFNDSGLANGRCYRYQMVVTDNVGNTYTLPSGDETIVDTAGPTAAFVSWQESSPNAWWDGSTSRLWFSNGAGGVQTADLLVSATDATGVTSVSFPDLLTAGWGPAGGGSDTVPEAGTVYRQQYSFTPTAFDPGTYNATAVDTASNLTTVAFDVERDNAPPTLVSVSHLDGTIGGANVPVTFSQGDDGTGSGVATWKLQRSETTTSAGACVAAGWTGYTDLVVDPPGTSYADTSVVDSRCYRYLIVATDRVGNTVTVTSGKVTTVDATPPTVTFNSWLEGAGAQWQHPVGNRMYVNTAQAGGFQLLIDANDGASAIAGVDYPALGTNWNAGGTDTSGSPYAYTYTWTASAANPGAQVATGRDMAGNPGTAAFEVEADTTPAGGVSISHFDGYTSSTVGTVTFDEGSDTQSGVATWRIERSETTLVGSTCTAAGWTAYALVGAVDPAAPTFADPGALASGKCYRYRIVVTDNVGNARTLDSGDVIMVDAADPTASFNSYVAGLNPQWQHDIGSTMYVNPAQSGSFTVRVNASDGVSGIDGVQFPDLNGAGSGWTPVGGSFDGIGVSPYTVSYTWTGPGINDPGAQSAAARDKAGNDLDVAFRIEADSAPPSGGTVAHANSYISTTFTDVTFTVGSDTQSLVASWQLERRDAPLTGGTCGTWTSWVPVGAPNEASPFTDTTLANARCYQYRLVMTDNVGNVGSTPSADTTKVDLGPPTVTFDSFEETSPDAYWSGAPSTTLWYDAAAAAPFSVDVLVTATDASGIWRVDFPDLGAAGWGPPGGGSDFVAEATDRYRQQYDFTPGASNPAPAVATGYDNATNTATAGFDLQPDGADPVGGSVGYPDGWQNGLSVNVTHVVGTDFDSGVASWQLQRRQTTAIVGGCDLAGWTAFADIGPPSPAGTFTDSPLADASCYQYRLVVTDNVGRTATYGSANEVRVDATAPTGSVTLAEGGGAQYQFLAAADTLYFNPAGSGSFTATATVGAPLSGMQDVAFPSIGTGWTGNGVDSSAPYATTYAWVGPAAPSSGGQNAVARSVSQATGNLPFNVIADSAGPTGATIVYPDQYQNTTSTTVTMTNGTDPIGISRRVLERSQAPLTSGNCGAYGAWGAVGAVNEPSPFTDATLSGAPPTCYRYRWTEYDNVENASSATRAAAVRVDAVNPSTPAPSRTGNTLNWAPQSDTHSGVDRIEFLIDGALTATLAPTAVSHNYGALPDGTYSFVVRTVDRAGNQSDSVPLVLLVDSTPPDAFTLIPPTNPVLPAITTGGTAPSCASVPTYASATPTFAWNASNDATSGLNRYEVSVDSVLRGTVAAPTTTWAMSPALAPGPHAWGVKVFDNFGLSTVSTPASMNVRVDTAAPATATAMSPAGNVWTTDATPTLMWTASDENCLARVRVLVDGAEYAVAAGAELSYTLTAAQLLPDGTHTWQIEAVDTAGRVRLSPTATFRVDTTGPTGITAVTPTDGSMTVPAADTMFDWTPGTDAVTGIATYQILIDGIVRTNCGWGTCPSATMSFGTDQWGTYPVSAGPHTWIVRATDVAGNSTDFTFTFTAVTVADVTPPSPFSLVSPADGANLAASGNQLIWQSSYDFSSIDRYEVWFDGILWTSMPGTTTTYSPDTSGGGTPVWNDTFDPQLLPWNLTSTPCGTAPSCNPTPWSIAAHPYALSGNSLGFTNQDGDKRELVADLGAVTVPPVGGALVAKIHYDTHTAYDGGQWEISTDGGTTWESTCNLGSILRDTANCRHDVLEPVGGYTDELAGHTGSPLKYREAYTGSNVGMTDTRIYLQKFAGTTVHVRLRFAFDLWTSAKSPASSVSSLYLDDVSLISGVLSPGAHTWLIRAFDPAGNMRQSTENWTFIV